MVKPGAQGVERADLTCPYLERGSGKKQKTKEPRLILWKPEYSSNWTSHQNSPVWIEGANESQEHNKP